MGRNFSRACGLFLFGIIFVLYLTDDDSIHGVVDQLNFMVVVPYLPEYLLARLGLLIHSVDCTSRLLAAMHRRNVKMDFLLAAYLLISYFVNAVSSLFNVVQK